VRSGGRQVDEFPPRIGVTAPPVQRLYERPERIITAASLVPGGAADAKPRRRQIWVMGLGELGYQLAELTWP
jgi:hypothetical protein